MKNKNNIQIIISTIIIIIVSCIAVLFVIKYNNEKDNLLNVNQEINKHLSTIEQLEKEAAAVKNNTVEKGIFPKFNIAMGKLKADNTTYNDNIYIFDLAVSTIESDGSVTINYNNKSYKVQGLSGKVVDVCISPFMDGATAYAVFLMEDGTVEYTNDIYDSVAQGGTGVIKSEGKIQNVKNIVRILATKAQKNIEENSITRMTLIGIDSDGYFHDLIFAAKGI